LFTFSGKAGKVAQAAGAAKAASKKLGGPLGVLVESISDSAKSITKSKEGPLQRATAFAVLMLTKPEAAQAFQGIIIVAGLAVALVAFVGAAAFNVSSGRGKNNPLRGPLLAIAAGVPFLLFTGLRYESFTKFLRVLTKEGVLGQLVLPLRAAGLVAAGGIDGQTPSAFAIFQLASIVTRLISDTNLIGRIVYATSNGQILQAFAHFDSELLATLVPGVLALFWLGAMRLRKAPDLVALALVIGMVASPAALSKAWPPLATIVGVQHKKFPHPDALIHVLSILHVTASLGLFVVGGPVSMLVCVVLFHVLTRIHGTDAFAALMPTQ